MNRRTRRIRATILTVILAISLVLGNLTPAVLAAEEHAHDETYGYSEGQCVYESDDESEDAGENNSALGEAEPVDSGSNETDADDTGKYGEASADSSDNADEDVSADSAEPEENAGEAEQETDEILAESATVTIGLSSMLLTTGSEDDELSFGTYTGLYSVVANNYTGTSYTIPSSYNNNIVYAIATKAFKDCTDLETITFSGNSVFIIGAEAFADCTSLTNITLPDSIIYIEHNAFKNCTSLKTLKLPESIYNGDGSVESDAFTGCTNLVLYVPVHTDTLDTYEGVKSISYYYARPADVTLTSDGTVSWTGLDATNVRYKVELCTGISTVSTQYVSAVSGQTSYSCTFDVSGLSGNYYARVASTVPTNSTVSISDSTPVTSDLITIYSSSTITFDANGGSVDTSTATTGSDGTLSSLPTPTRTGYIFDGWYTAETGGDEVTTSTVFTSAQTVYTHWTECTHGDSTVKPTCTDSATCSVCGGTIAATGHNFSGDYNAWDDTGHWHVCKHDGCTETDTVQAHIFNDADYKYDEGTATYTSDGTETATCAAEGCNYTNTRTSANHPKLNDEILPTGTITVKENVFTSFINTITFGIFGKNNMDVTIEASDAETGVESVEYLIYEVSDGDTGLSQSDLAAKNDWLTYSSPFSISSNGKYIIYAKITDNSGNVAYIRSNGIVKYTDAAADTQSISFTKTSTTDVTASVTANGNTISAITNGSETLGSSDYSVSYNTDNTATITFDSSYLNTLAAGSYTLTLTYNPQGETYVEDTRNDAPASTSMGLVVSRADGSVADIENISKTYDGKAVFEPTYTASSTGAATIEYKVKDADDSTYISTAPTDAGSYTVRVTVAADDDYTEASATKDFTISPAELTVTADSMGIIYGDAAPGYSVTYAGFADDEDASDLSGTLAFSCAYDPANDQSNNAGTYTITPSGYTSDNYTITYQTGTLTVNPKAATVRVESKSSVYGDSIVELTAMDSGIINGDTNVYSLSTDASSTAAVGKYNIDGIALDANYSITFGDTEDAYEITERELTVDVTVSDKQYDGTTSAAIASATLQNIANNDVVSLINGTATFASAEVGKNVSISFTDFTLSGDAAVLKNYTLTQPSGVTADITNYWKPDAGTEYTVTAANDNGWLNTDFTVKAQDGYELSLTNTAEGTWTAALTETDETGNGSITFYVREKSTGAISLETTETYQIDKTVPTGTVSIGDGTTAWDKFLETISFGLYYNSGQSVNASANDELSGMDQIAYVESETALTLSALKALAEDEWTAMGAATGGNVDVPLRDGKQFIYYIRLTDKAGNVTYLSTDGATYDTSTPVIGGIVNGKTYCESVSFTVTDANLDYVTVNGTETADYTLQADGLLYEIIAYDKAGNSTKVTVTVNNGHTFTNYVSDGNAGCTENGTETAKCEYCDATNTRTEENSATGHSWSSDWSNDAVYHWHECTNDGCTLTDDSKKGSYGTHIDGDGDGLCDDCGYIMEIELIQTQIVQTDLTEVPDGLKDTEFNTVEKITDEITRVLTSEAGYTDENVAVYDVKLQISTDGGKTWIDATEANFPAEGITIVLPYPEGTDGSTHDFTVTHMFTVTSAKLGIVAGETEQPEVTKLEDGIQVTLKGLSPVGVAWKELSTNETTDSGSDIKTTDTTGTTGTAESSGSTDTAGSAQTGDETNILLWIVVMILSATGITVAVICGRKRKYNL